MAKLRLKRTPQETAELLGIMIRNIVKLHGSVGIEASEIEKHLEAHGFEKAETAAVVASLISSQVVEESPIVISPGEPEIGPS